MKTQGWTPGHIVTLPYRTKPVSIAGNDSEPGRLQRKVIINNANMTISTAKICYLRTWGTDKPFPGQAARQRHNLRLTDGTNGAVCARANKRCVHPSALIPKEK